jgi:tetratricopeptide (TPR) repeat protein
MVERDIRNVVAERVAGMLDVGSDVGGDVAEERPTGIPEVPGYQITGRLGEGGMGTVWRAVQLSTRREVALKLVGHAAVGSHRARLRFDREVGLAARLEHPNIARIYDSGMSRGLYYYAMELVEGEHLDRYVAESKLGRGEILALMREVCSAVQHAHHKGVIHRDLKPSNILVTKEGEPKVVDFGLARALEDEAEGLTLTLEGQWAGTPAFMSPEQAAADSKRIDTRTDVWALGAVLYVLLTGQTPHDTSGPRHLVLLRRIADDEVRRPRGIDGELEAILLKALDRDPDRRYESAGALARDIANYADGRPVSARAPSAGYILRKWMKRRRREVGAAVVCVAVLAGIVALVHRTATYHTNRYASMLEGHRHRQANSSRPLLVANMLLASEGRFAEALKLYDQMIETGHEDCRVWRDDACLHLVLGDEARYRQRCLEILQKFGGTSDPDVAEVSAKVCLLRADAPGDWRPVVELADRALAAPAGDNGLDVRWFYLVKGMAEFRIGHHQESLRWFERSLRGSGDNYRRVAYARYFSAMACYRLGSRAEASVHLREGIAVDREVFGPHWADEAALMVIRREAESLLLGGDPGTSK